MLCTKQVQNGSEICCKNPMIILSVHRRINISDFKWVSDFYDRIKQE